MLVIFFLCLFVRCVAMEEKAINLYLPTIEDYSVAQEKHSVGSQYKSAAGPEVRVRCLDGDVYLSGRENDLLVKNHAAYKGLNQEDQSKLFVLHNKISFNVVSLPIQSEALLAAAEFLKNPDNIALSYELINGLDYCGYQGNLAKSYKPKDLCKIYDSLASDNQSKKDLVRNFLLREGIEPDGQQAFEFKKRVSQDNETILKITCKGKNIFYVPFNPIVSCMKKVLEGASVTKMQLVNIPFFASDAESNPFSVICKKWPTLKTIIVRNSQIPIIPRGTFVDLSANCQLVWQSNKTHTIEKGAFAPVGGIFLLFYDNPLSKTSKDIVIHDTQNISPAQIMFQAIKASRNITLKQLLGNNLLFVLEGRQNNRAMPIHTLSAVGCVMVSILLSRMLIGYGAGLSSLDKDDFACFLIGSVMYGWTTNYAIFLATEPSLRTPTVVFS